MLSNISNKDKRKFDIALINSCVVYWYMKNIDGTYKLYMDKINNDLEWLAKRPSDKVKYNAMKFVKDFILKYQLTEEFLREYCSKLEYNNPREDYIRSCKNIKLQKNEYYYQELHEYGKEFNKS